jgi:hypothetical protein
VGDIERHYRAAREPPFVPDLIFGWEHDPARRKPNPWPVQEALARFGCAADEALVDSFVKPGHPSTPGYNDPQYPLNGRVVA